MTPSRSFSILVLAVLFAGCSTDRLVISEPTTTALTLRQYSNETQEPIRGIQIRTMGRDTHVTWLATGQQILFKDSLGYSGQFGFDLASFRLGNLSVEITDRHLTVVSQQNSHKHTLTRLIGGKLTRLFEGRIMIIHADGSAETIAEDEYNTQ